jgi:nitrogen fixation/metabolism regulation signal transduction histidine kinase
MKLYTEEQVKQMMLHGNIFINTLSGEITETLKGPVTPIELPSDEEIEKEISKVYGRDCEDFYGGAKWVIKQIKNQVK